MTKRLRFATDYKKVMLLDISDPDVKAGVMALVDSRGSSPLREEEDDDDPPLQFKGRAGDDAILCTRTKTYQVRSCETSNELLLTRNEDLETIVGSGAHQTLEPVRVPPRLENLRDVLSEILRERRRKRDALKMQQPSDEEKDSVENYSSSSSTVVSLREVWDRVQASRAELTEAMLKVGCVKLEDEGSGGETCYSFIDPVVARECFLAVLREIQSTGFDASRESDPDSTKIQNVETIINSVKSDYDFSEEAVRHVLKTHCRPRRSEEEGDDSLVLDRDSVAKFIAESVLIQHQTMPLSAFIEECETALPHGIKIDPEVHLRGLAVVVAPAASSSSSKPGGEEVRYFPFNRLSNDPLKRFEALFEAKRFWTHAEIVPYLLDLPGVVNGDPSALLRKYTRSFASPGGGTGRVYGKR